MLPVRFLILWAMYCRNGVLSVINHETANFSESTIATTTLAMESQESVNEKAAFRNRDKDQNFPDGLSKKKVQPVPHTSIPDFQTDNSTEVGLQGMRKGNKELKITEINHLLIITWNNRTTNYTTSRRTPRELQSFKHVPIDGSFIVQNIAPTSQEIAEASADAVVTYPGGLVDDNSYWEKLYVSFEELGLGDIVIAPYSFTWTVCRNSSDVVPEILRKLDDPSYPLPLAVAARLTLETRFGFMSPETDSKCASSQWTSMSILFVSDYHLSHTQLLNFIPTACSCKE